MLYFLVWVGMAGTALIFIRIVAHYNLRRFGSTEDTMAALQQARYNRRHGEVDE
jgi:hypothetical protein